MATKGLRKAVDGVVSLPPIHLRRKKGFGNNYRMINHLQSKKRERERKADLGEVTKLAQHSSSSQHAIWGERKKRRGGRGMSGKWPGLGRKR